jgi:hypothetical protein
MFYCGIYGYTNGNVNQIFRGSDGNPTPCNTTAFPLMYFTAPFGINAVRNRVCVSKCPGAGATTLSCRTNSMTPDCNIDFSLDSYTTSDSNWMNALPANPEGNYLIGYNSTELVGRLCVPSAATFAKFTSTINGTFGSAASLVASGASNYLSAAVNDLRAAWPMILASLGICIFLSFLYLILLRCFAGCMIWFSLFGSIAALAGLGAVLFVWSGQLKDYSSSISVIDDTIKTVAGSAQYY